MRRVMSGTPGNDAGQHRPRCLLLTAGPDGCLPLQRAGTVPAFPCPKAGTGGKNRQYPVPPRSWALPPGSWALPPGSWALPPGSRGECARALCGSSQVPGGYAQVLCGSSQVLSRCLRDLGVCSQAVGGSSRALVRASLAPGGCARPPGGSSRALGRASHVTELSPTGAVLGTCNVHVRRGYRSASATPAATTAWSCQRRRVSRSVHASIRASSPAVRTSRRRART